MLNYKPHPAILPFKERFDQFFLGYTQAIGFSSTEDSEEGSGDSLVANGGGDFEESHEESWNEWSLLLNEQERQEIIDDAVGFFLEAKDMIEGKDYTAGTDFHYTRCHHGTGFWDGDWGHNGQTLTEMSHAYGSQSLWGTKDKKGKVVSAYICHYAQNCQNGWMAVCGQPQ